MVDKAISFIATVLGWQTRRLYKKNDFKVIAIAGGIGKTSTKFAIVSVLGQKYRVRSQEGNYNHLVSVPLIFFGHQMPNPYNPLAWLKIFIKNEQILRHKYPFDVVVAEVGTDGPGQIRELGRYLKADIAVLTAIVPEHMEYFKDLNEVAAEELSVTEFSNILFANKDLCDAKYLKGVKVPVETYSMAEAKKLNAHNPNLVSDVQLYSVSASIVVAQELGVELELVKKGVSQIKPVAGRLNLLKGVNSSTIIDDTYNASPAAMTSSLEALYKFEAAQRIAILGSMNELGEFSKEAHIKIGEQCDPEKLDLVVTIGDDASNYLAPAAEKEGCRVVKFRNPYEAGEYVKSRVEKGAAILAKGSQNGVFAEEAVKHLLANPDDSSKLVRQSEDWLSKKQKAFLA